MIRIKLKMQVLYAWSLNGDIIVCLLCLDHTLTTVYNEMYCIHSNTNRKYVVKHEKHIELNINNMVKLYGLFKNTKSLF